MGLNHSPSIVTNGLVLCLDAANRKSYPGSGTTWTDLSGNRNNGTLLNGVTYSANNLGSLGFNGVNNYITVGVTSTNGLYLANTANVTVSCWAKTSNTSIENQNLVMWEDQVDVNNIEPIRIALNWTIASNAPFNPFFGLVNTSAVGVNLVANSVNIASNTYYYVSGTYDGSSAKIYVNGKLENQISYTGNFRTPVSGTSARWIIGRGEIPNTDRLLNGSISQVQIYNRALTAAEIQQNFNATRGRYGL